VTVEQTADRCSDDGAAVTNIGGDDGVNGTKNDIAGITV
jgi:hypothetical protein